MSREQLRHYNFKESLHEEGSDTGIEQTFLSKVKHWGRYIKYVTFKQTCFYFWKLQFLTNYCLLEINRILRALSNDNDNDNAYE